MDGTDKKSISTINYKREEYAHCAVSHLYHISRRDNIAYTWDTGMRGPPGIRYGQITINKINGIEDILSVTPLSAQSLVKTKKTFFKNK